MATEILDPRRNLKDLKRALDKITEITTHEDFVIKAFAQGKKPPIKFSEDEFNTTQQFLKFVLNLKTKSSGQVINEVVDIKLQTQVTNMMKNKAVAAAKKCQHEEEMQVLNSPKLPVSYREKVKKKTNDKLRHSSDVNNCNLN